MGRNALDAVNLMYTGVGLHRQQMPPTDRVHGVVTAGGERPNVIPEHAEMLFYLRSEHPESLAVLSERLADIARGAALMTGCGVELSWDEAPPYLPVRGNGPLAAAWTSRYGERGRTVLAARRGAADVRRLHRLRQRVLPGARASTRWSRSPTRTSRCTPASSRTPPSAPEADAGGPRRRVRPGRRDAPTTSPTPTCAPAAAADFEAAGGAVDVPSYFERR